jgi:hypothetical protein
MAGRRQAQLTRSDVLPVVAAHVGPILGHTEYTVAGVAVFVPAVAPRPDGLDAAAAEPEAGGCAVAVDDLGEADPRGRWRVTVTKPGWQLGAGRSRSRRRPVERSPGARAMPAPGGAPEASWAPRPGGRRAPRGEVEPPGPGPRGGGVGGREPVDAGQHVGDRAGRAVGLHRAEHAGGGERRGGEPER